jgi:phage tail-like protein
MSLSNGDSGTIHNFAIQIDGIQVEFLSKISGLSNTQDVIKGIQNTPAGKAVVRNMPGISQGGQVTVTRGSNGSQAFTNWITSSLDGDMANARKMISIILMDYQGAEIRRFNLIDAWCSSTAYGDLVAGQASVHEETITIVYESMTYG